MSESGEGAVLAWHFLREGGLTRDGRTVHVGETLHVDPPLILCWHGLHASRRLIDAPANAPGPVLCRVRCSGEVIDGSDKLVCTDRTVLAMADVSRQLHEFACGEAERALRKSGVDDERPWRAIEAKRAWLRGEATDTDLAIAWTAVRPPARNAARDAPEVVAREVAWNAARVATWATAWPAARYTARAAAWDAAWAATWDATWDAVRTEQNSRLESLLAPVLGLEPRSAESARKGGRDDDR